MQSRDRDYKPEQGQKSNQNWDDMNDQQTTNPNQKDQGEAREQSDARGQDDAQNTTGYGSAERNKGDRNTPNNVGPLDADLEQLPSEKRRDRGSNLTGPGLG